MCLRYIQLDYNIFDYLNSAFDWWWFEQESSVSFRTHFLKWFMIQKRGFGHVWLGEHTDQLKLRRKNLQPRPHQVFWAWIWKICSRHRGSLYQEVAYLLTYTLHHCILSMNISFLETFVYMPRPQTDSRCRCWVFPTLKIHCQGSQPASRKHGITSHISKLGNVFNWRVQFTL